MKQNWTAAGEDWLLLLRDGSIHHSDGAAGFPLLLTRDRIGQTTSKDRLSRAAGAFLQSIIISIIETTTLLCCCADNLGFSKLTYYYYYWD